MELDYETMIRIQLEVTNKGIVETFDDDEEEAEFRAEVVEWLKGVKAAGGQPHIPAETIL